MRISGLIALLVATVFWGTPASLRAEKWVVPDYPTEGLTDSIEFLPDDSKLSAAKKKKKKKAKNKSKGGGGPYLKVSKINAKYIPYRICRYIDPVDGPVVIKCLRPTDILDSVDGIFCGPSVIQFNVFITNVGGKFPSAKERPAMANYIANYADFIPIILHHERLNVPFHVDDDHRTEGLPAQQLNADQTIEIEFYRPAIRHDVKLNPYTISLFVDSPLFNIGADEQKEIEWSPNFPGAVDLQPAGGNLQINSQTNQYVAKIIIRNNGGAHPAGMTASASVPLMNGSHLLIPFGTDFVSIAAGETRELYSEIRPLPSSPINFDGAVESRVRTRNCPEFSNLAGKSDGTDANPFNDVRLSTDVKPSGEFD